MAYRIAMFRVTNRLGWLPFRGIDGMLAFSCAFGNHAPDARAAHVARTGSASAFS